MTKEIIIQGYNTIWPNKLYESQGLILQGPLNLSRALVLKRIKAPEIEETLDAIVDLAKGTFNQDNIDPDVKEIASQIPDSYKKLIIERENKTMDHLRKHIAFSKFYVPGKNYCLISSSLIEETEMDDFEQLSDSNESSDFERIIKAMDLISYGRKVFHFSIKLDDQLRVPSEDNLIKFLNNENVDKNLFRVAGNKNQSLGDLMRVYRSLSPELSSLIDFSSDAKYDNALTTLTDTIACERKNQMEYFAYVIKDGIKAMEIISAKTHHKQRFDNPSLN